MLRGYERAPKGAAVFDDAKRWEGWGTALKPAHEPIALARKPISEGAVARNMIRHETGGLNIDASRVNWQSNADAAAAAAAAQRVCRDTPGRERWAGNGGVYLDPAGSLVTWEDKADLGRWPANVLHDGSLEVIEAFAPMHRPAARFFYSPKASREEREFGMVPLSVAGDSRSGSRPPATKNIHPTVKPLDLMRWLATLVTAPGGTVIDPFMGSGSTGIACVRAGFRFVGIEQSPEYFDIARRRIAHAVDEAERMPDMERRIEAAVHEFRRAQQIELIF